MPAANKHERKNKSFSKLPLVRQPRTSRQIAWEILDQVEQESAWAEELLTSKLSRAKLSSTESRLCRELTFGIIKYRRYLDFVLSAFLQKTPKAISLVNLLRLGTYQLLCLDKIPEHAAVHETVEMAKAKFSEPQVKLVNAVLRNLLRQGAPALPDPKIKLLEHLGIRYSFPDFLVERWLKRYGEEASSEMFMAANEAAPVAVRVHLSKISVMEAAKRLAEQGALVDPGIVPGALVLQSGFGNPGQLPGVAEGYLYFQDQAAQMVGYIVDPKPNQVCLDLCSAPGGKATQLAELLAGTGQVMAYDINPVRLLKVKENAERLQLTNLKIMRVIPDRLLFDHVIVDAPCSGLGTLRRHAEARWRVKPEQISELATMQAQLLHQAAGFVKPDGSLVYSTCTTEPEENEEIVRKFIKTHPQFVLEPGPGSSGYPAAKFWGRDGFFRTYPGYPELDGMFAARLVKKSQKAKIKSEKPAQQDQLPGF